MLNELVVCTHNGPLTPEQARWAVVLSAAGPAATCGLTSLAQWKVRGFETADVHVIVCRGARVLGVLGVNVVVHESRRFGPADIRTGSGPPSTSLDRSTIDAAAWSKQPLTASRIVVAPVQQRLTLPGNLLLELAVAGAIRHRRLLRSLLLDLDGGNQALSEVEFLRWCRRHHFPRPQLQVRLDSGGRRRYLDATFRLPDGRVLYVEVDGGIHLTLTTRWTDTAKDNDALLDGLTTLRFPSVAIYSDDPRAVAQLRRALGLVSTSGCSGTR